MCRGFAILANEKEILYKENNFSHSKIGNEDDYLRLEILMDTTKKCGYRIELDGDIDDVCKEIYAEKGLYIKDKPNPKIMKKVEKWCKDNEMIIYRAFVFGCQSDSTINGNNRQHYSTIKGDNYQPCSTINGNNDQSDSTIGKEMYIGLIKFEKYPKLTKLLKEIKDSWDLTLNELVEWIMKNPEKAKKIMK